MKYTINKDPRGPLYLTEYEMKQNYNCPDSEKSGTGKGSCGGSEGKGEQTGSDKKDMSPKERQSKIDEINETMKAVTKTSDKNSRGEFTNPKVVERMKSLLEERRSLEGYKGKNSMTGEHMFDEKVKKDLKSGQQKSPAGKSTITDHHEIALKTSGDSNKKTFEREDSGRKAEVIKNKSGDYDVKLDDGRTISGRSKSNAETIAKNYAAHGYKKGSQEVASKSDKGSSPIERFGGRDITEMEDEDLTLPELKEKMAALEESHDYETAKIVQKSIKSRK